MWGRWRKVRADRRLWRKAGSLSELGRLMARWLEGELSMWPGYAVAGPDEETAPHIPVLARLNRAGFLTDQSQPGCDGSGFDGARWQQRAAVSGLVGDEEMLHALARVAETRRLTILVRLVDEASERPGVTCTRIDGEKHTVFGGRLSRRDLRFIWRAVSWKAFAEIEAAWQVTVIDPEFGRNDLLWTAFDEALDLIDEVPNPLHDPITQLGEEPV